MDTVSRDFMDTLTYWLTWDNPRMDTMSWDFVNTRSDIGVHMYACILATLGQSRDGRSVLGFHGYSDIGVLIYACMLATLGQSRDGHSVLGFVGTLI